jgi:hypothetical protein
MGRGIACGLEIINDENCAWFVQGTGRVVMHVEIGYARILGGHHTSSGTLLHVL